MKKKIIDGILMSALLLSGTTSFVSCKDNVDDVETGIRMDMNTLQEKIKELEAKIPSSPVDPTDLTPIQKQLDSLKTALNGKVDQSEFNALSNKVDSLAELLSKINSSAITGVIVQETLDRVVGTINLPGFNPGFLAAYVGQNLSGLDEFPIAYDDYNVDADGNYLLPEEINVQPVGNSGKMTYLINGTGNAGKIYFSVNPVKINPANVNFSLVNSTGEVSPIELSDVRSSQHLITFAMGKHGNGLTYEDVEENPYLYEANATVSLEGIEKIHFDYTKWGYNNLWDAGASLNGVDQGADAEAQNIFGRFQWLINEIKNNHTVEGAANVLSGALKIIQDFYNGVYQQREKLQKQALRVSWDDGSADGNAVISDFGITTVTINPLNFKQMFLLSAFAPKWNITALTPLVNKIVKAVQSKMPNITAIGGVAFTDDGKLAVYGTGATVATPGAIIAFIDINDDGTAAGKNSLAGQLNQIVDQVNKILKPYNKAKNATATGIMTRVNNYLNNVTYKLLSTLGPNPYYSAVEPTLLFESNYGIERLFPMMTLQAGDYNFIMTSMTEEYIVPMYMKYVAVLYGGKVMESHLFNGSEKIVQLHIPNHECEVIYQASDFYGNVVTKRYPLNR